MKFTWMRWCTAQQRNGALSLNHLHLLWCYSNIFWWICVGIKTRKGREIWNSNLSHKEEKEEEKCGASVEKLFMGSYIRLQMM